MKSVLAISVTLNILFCVAVGLAQTNGDWIRVQSNHGELSIEVPTSHRVFFNARGFSVLGNARDDLPLKNIYLLSAYVDGTLISVELYDGSKAAKDELYEHDAFAKNGRSVREFKRGQIKIREIINRTDKYYSIRQFFSTATHVCILTTASRSGETKNMRRFLDSLAFESDSNSLNAATATTFSSLKTTEAPIEFDKSPIAVGDLGATNLTPDDPSVKPFVVIRIPRAPYVSLARDSGVQGTIRLKLELGPDGFISKVIVQRSLPAGLLRQSLFSALRAKLLPKEKDGIPIVANVTIEFGFNIY
jgi:hypothetical protein